jgi:hypothetical protein
VDQLVLFQVMTFLAFHGSLRCSLSGSASGDGLQATASIIPWCGPFADEIMIAA